MPTLDSIFERVLANTFTVNDAHQRMLLLQDFLDHAVYQQSGEVNLVEALQNRYKDRDAAAAQAIAAWGDDALNFFRTGDVHHHIAAMKERIDASPILILYVPVILETSHIVPLIEWSRAHIDRALLLDIRVDKAAAGGCIIVWQNVRHDFSFPYFLAKRSADVAVLINAPLESMATRDAAQVA